MSVWQEHETACVSTRLRMFNLHNCVRIINLSLSLIRNNPFSALFRNHNVGKACWDCKPLGFYSYFWWLTWTQVAVCVFSTQLSHIRLLIGVFLFWFHLQSMHEAIAIAALPSRLSISLSQGCIFLSEEKYFETKINRGTMQCITLCFFIMIYNNNLYCK